MKKIIASAILGLALLNSCQDMDIPPKNIITPDDLLTSESGMEIYMARLYSYMPFEDFKYRHDEGLNRQGWLAGFGWDGTGETLNRDGLCRSFTGESNPYWGEAFTTLHDVNFLIETLPDYKDNFAEITYNHYLGEAYFVRASVFYAMARRFGGVPLVTKVINYPAESDVLEVPRASEEETWDQVLADFQMAADLMMTKSPKSGYANRYVALSYKSQAALYAGSVAKYNETVTGRLTGLGAKTGVRVMGFDENRWENASKRYFTEAYKAAMEVINEGGYSLYKAKWAANDPQAMVTNLRDMLTDLSSPENIFVREYLYPTSCHALDAYNLPRGFGAPLCAGMCITEDFCELFDGFDRYPDGTIKVTTGNTNTEGEYIMYDTPDGIYANAEPRLKAYAILPGDRFKGKDIEIRAGIYTGSTPIKPLFDNYSYANAFNPKYQHLDIANGDDKTLWLAAKPLDLGQQFAVPVTLPDGTVMNAAGEQGPVYDDGGCAMTGIYCRKWLNEDPSFDVSGEGDSDQHFILMRYAQVLLNAAEAAVELSMAGVASPDGSNMLEVATTAINDIRERAGAVLLTSQLKGDEQSRNIVRKERRKELAFEHLSKWDIRRWRVQHYEGRDGFWGETRDKNHFSDQQNYRFRGIYPFYSAQDGKYFFDIHYQWMADKTFSYSVLDYYFEIPGGEVAKSKYIDQQPNR